MGKRGRGAYAAAARAARFLLLAVIAALFIASASSSVFNFPNSSTSVTGVNCKDAHSKFEYKFETQMPAGAQRRERRPK